MKMNEMKKERKKQGVVNSSEGMKKFSNANRFNIN